MHVIYVISLNVFCETVLHPFKLHSILLYINVLPYGVILIIINTKYSQAANDYILFIDKC